MVSTINLMRNTIKIVSTHTKNIESWFLITIENVGL